MVLRPPGAEIAATCPTTTVEGMVPGINFARLFREHYPRVYRYILLRINDEAVAEDLTAEVFERAFRYRKTYDPDRSAFSTWIGRLAHNWVTNYMVHIQYRQRHETPLDQDTEQLSSDDASPEEGMIYDEEVQAMFGCLQQLNERDRQVVSLRFGSNMRNKQIAELMGLEANTVAVILLRALDRLRDCQDKL